MADDLVQRTAKVLVLVDRKPRILRNEEFSDVSRCLHDAQSLERHGVEVDGVLAGELCVEMLRDCAVPCSERVQRFPACHRASNPGQRRLKELRFLVHADLDQRPLDGAPLLLWAENARSGEVGAPSNRCERTQDAVETEAVDRSEEQPLPLTKPEPP